MNENKIKIKGKIKIYSLGPKIEYDKKGKPIRKKLLGIMENLWVETGRELLADIMVNEISLYTNGIYPEYLAVGDDNTAATVDDWKLVSEKQRAQISAANMERVSGTSIARYTTIIPSGGGTYTIWEAGLFLSATEPTSDPQLTPAQKANAMLTRSVHSTGIPKADADNIEITYDVYF